MRHVLTWLLVFVLSSYFVSSACLSLNPAIQNNITTNTALCGGYVQTNYTGYFIYIPSGNFILDFNSTRIKGNNVGTAVFLDTAKNVTLTRGNLSYFDNGIWTSGSAGSQVQNVTISNMEVSYMNDIANIFINSGFNILINNVSSHDAHNITGASLPPHTLYVGADTGRSTRNIVVINSLFYRSDNLCIHSNVGNNTQQNNSVYANLTMWGCLQGGMDLDGNANVTIRNVSISHSQSIGIALGEGSDGGGAYYADLNKISYSRFDNLSDVDFKLWHSGVNIIEYNNYTRGYGRVDVRNGNVTLAKFYENQSMEVRFSSNNPFAANATFNMTPTGNKNFTIQSQTLARINVSGIIDDFPNNDLRNASDGSVLYYNVDNLSVNMTPNAKFILEQAGGCISTYAGVITYFVSNSSAITYAGTACNVYTKP